MPELPEVQTTVNILNKKIKVVASPNGREDVARFMRIFDYKPEEYTLEECRY